MEAVTVDQRMLKDSAFPPEFRLRVDMTKVNLEVIKKWIVDRLIELLGFEDDIVTGLVTAQLECEQYPKIKNLQIMLTGFLGPDSPPFCQDLWNMLLSAQQNAQGIPEELLEAKKLELLQEKDQENEQTRGQK